MTVNYNTVVGTNQLNH